MILPTEPSEAIAINPRLLVIYGQEKIGKTTLCSKLGELGTYCILEVDKSGCGADFVKCVRLPIKSYDDLITTCSEIIKAGRPYKYLVLDTATEFEDHCERDATKQYRLSPQGKNFTGRSVLEILSGDFSPGYRWLRMSFDVAMAKLMDAAPYVIVICHLKDKLLRVTSDDKGKVNTEVSAADIDLAGKIRAKLTTKSDATAFIYRTTNANKESKMWINFKTDEIVNCGSRCQHLVQQNFEMDWKKIYLPDKV